VRGRSFFDQGFNTPIVSPEALAKRYFWGDGRRVGGFDITSDAIEA
jgi:hypothetical protein